MLVLYDGVYIKALHSVSWLCYLVSIRPLVYTKDYGSAHVSQKFGHRFQEMVGRLFYNQLSYNDWNLWDSLQYNVDQRKFPFIERKNTLNISAIFVNPQHVDNKIKCIVPYSLSR